MSVVGALFKTGLIVAATIVGQRLWDRHQVADFWLKLDELTLKVRHDELRVGPVRANVKVLSRDLVQAYTKKLLLVDSLVEFEQRVEIYIESIPD